MRHSRRRARRVGVLLFAVLPALAAADDAFQWSGFAIARGTSGAKAPLDADPLSGQLQLGLDWSNSPKLTLHLGLLARTDADDTEHGYAGTPEAYVESDLRHGANRFKLRAGAFFLPTSRENVDALWENPYTISSSALNTWFGQELRPIGIDASYLRGGARIGATLFRGNDTFGALPVDLGWSLSDRWALLGQDTPTAFDFYSSVSAETDHRLGYSARAGWSATNFSVLFTHIDNRADALPHGEYYNWGTRFEVLGFDASLGDWTLAGEGGWGPTTIKVSGVEFRSDLRAAYLLGSRRFRRHRVSLRIDWYRGGRQDGEALTLAYFWTPPGHASLGCEFLATNDTARAILQLRYGFARR